MQTKDGPEPKVPTDKIKAFNLLEITESLLPYLKEISPNVFKNNDVVKSFKYVKFHWGEVYFYSERYIQRFELYQLEAEFNNLLADIYK